MKEPKLKEVESMGDFIENALKILEFAEEVNGALVKCASGLHGYLVGGLAVTRYFESQKRREADFGLLIRAAQAGIPISPKKRRTK